MDDDHDGNGGPKVIKCSALGKKKAKKKAQGKGIIG
jgi:hypothetical protein